MPALRAQAPKPAEVVQVPGIMSGDPVVSGTRVLAEVVLLYLRTGHSRREIFEDYPTLPVDGIDAVVSWAEATYGQDWMTPPAGADAP